jgi:hypothetical protein
MGRAGLTAVLATMLFLAVLGPSGALAQPHFHQCQRPAKTGVEVYDLHNITPRSACPPALALFAWEFSSVARAHALYGCIRPKPEAAGYPFLRLHRFHGYALSLRGPNREFTMSRGSHSFRVTGTDFPLNCT